MNDGMKHILSFFPFCRSVHEKETCCLELLLQPDMTYFKDHLGKTVMHKAASVGSRLAVDIIASLRHDTIHDIDKKVCVCAVILI